jgi:hypothetical protein
MIYRVEVVAPRTASWDNGDVPSDQLVPGEHSSHREGRGQGGGEVGRVALGLGLLVGDDCRRDMLAAVAWRCRMERELLGVAQRADASCVKGEEK